ncbi:MAG: AAA family ATPase [Candidatus Woesearchaeota archaeon]
MIVVITGTPGTGKTSLARFIARNLGFKRIDVAPLIKSISCGYDLKRGCEIVDSDKFVKALLLLIKGKKQKLVIDSHLAHCLPSDIVGLCIVTKCDLLVLKKRLDKRYKGNPEKVRENLDAEIFDICHNEAVEFGHKVEIVDTTKGLKLQNIKKIISSK